MSGSPTRRGWFRRKQTKVIDTVQIVDEDESYFTYAITDSELAQEVSMSSGSTDDRATFGDSMKCQHEDRLQDSSLRWEANRIIETERALERQVKQLSSSPQQHGSNEPSSSRLINSNGVMLFDGMEDDKSILMDDTENNDDKSIPTDRSLNFVKAPSDYDPIASGFYKPKGKDGEAFYDDIEDDQNISNNEDKVSITEQKSHEKEKIGKYAGCCFLPI